MPHACSLPGRRLRYPAVPLQAADRSPSGLRMLSVVRRRVTKAQRQLVLGGGLPFLYRRMIRGVPVLGPRPRTSSPARGGQHAANLALSSIEARRADPVMRGGTRAHSALTAGSAAHIVTLLG